MTDNKLTVKSITVDEESISPAYLQGFLNTLQKQLQGMNVMSTNDPNNYIEIKQKIVLLRFVEIKFIKESKGSLLTELRQHEIYIKDLQKYNEIIENYNSSKKHSLENILRNKYTVPELNHFNDAKNVDQAQISLTAALQNITFTQKDQLQKFFYSIISADPITIAIMLYEDKKFNKDFAKFYHSEPFKIITKTILIAAAAACITCVLTPWLGGLAVTSTVADIAIKTCIGIAIASPGVVVPPLVNKMFKRNIEFSTQDEKTIMDNLNKIDINDTLSTKILEYTKSKQDINTKCYKMIS